MKHSNRQFGDHFSGFGRQSEKFSLIGVCIRRNFTPWFKFIRACFYVGGGPQVGQVPRLTVVVYIYT